MPFDAEPSAPPARPHPGARTLRLGYVPLTDAAPLLVAQALGLFEGVGLRVRLSAEAGWATLRDKLAFGGLDGAHLLGPMPIALAAGLGGVRARVTVAAGLGANGNTLTLSPTLAAAIPGFRQPLPATAFAALVRRRQRESLPPLIFAVVFPFSSHNYLLRHWLAAGGLDPDRDLRLTVVPPPHTAAQLAAGHIDGFCAGEPWGSHAAALGAGRVALGSGDVWPDHPEKLLAFAEGVAERDPESAIAATAAVLAAARWLDDPANHAEAVAILGPALPGVAPSSIAAAFAGRADGVPVAAPLRFRSATLPRREAAAWWLRQMRRWGHLDPALPDAELLAPWDTALWRAAAARLREPEPAFLPTLPADTLETAAE